MKTGLIVQKYGGSSLDSPARIKEVAGRIAESARRSYRMIVIVSAMGSATDELMALAHEISPHPPRRELDMLLTVGERISMALLSMALNDLGFPAISFTGSQSGIMTSMLHTRAIIEEIRGDRIRQALGDGKIAIVAGFQGVSFEREITTLGRGGSDTTAVALAACMGAEQCVIYFDYSGLFTADPRFVPSARRVPCIDYDEMLELASLGAKVLHYRAADIARRYRVPVELLSSFENSPGTLVRAETGENDMEKASYKSVTCIEDAGLITVTLDGSGDPGISKAFENSGIRLIHYERSLVGGKTIVACIVEGGDFDRAESIIRALGLESSETAVNRDAGVVSVVGSGFAQRADALSSIEDILEEFSIPVFMLWNSSLSVSCLVPRCACKEAVVALHNTLIAVDQMD